MQSEDQKTAEEHLQHVNHVYQEMLTAVAPGVKDALEALHDVILAEMKLCRLHAGPCCEPLPEPSVTRQ